MKKITYLLVLMIISSSYVFADPVVDPASIKNQDKYYRDNAECKALAKDNKIIRAARVMLLKTPQLEQELERVQEHYLV